MRNRRERGPKNGSLSATKLSKKSGLDIKKLNSENPKSPSKIPGKGKELKKTRIKGETSFIIEEMMSQGIAKGDITMSDGTGTDNMTCILIQFRDPEDVKAEKENSIKEESKQSS